MSNLAVTEELQALVLLGQLTPRAVVARASDPDSALHVHFEWNDGKAAYEHRLGQARTLIRSVRVDVVIDSRVLKVPRYVHNPLSHNEQGYVETLSLRAKQEAGHAAMVNELDRALSCLARAKLVASALGLQDKLDRLIHEAVVLKEGLT